MQIPDGYQEFLDLSPEQIQQLGDELVERTLDANSMNRWLEDWAKLAALFQECMARFDIATAINTADDTARQRVAQYRETVLPILHRLDQQLSERQLRHADLLPASLQAAEARWAQANRLNQSQTALDRLNRESEWFNQYAEIVGRHTIQWEGADVSARRLAGVVRLADRERREQAWRAMRERQGQDRDAIGRIWSELLDLRSELAQLNGFDNYLDYRWVELGRTDYTPDDSDALHAAVLKYWAPLHSKVMSNRKARLKLDALRPWDQETPTEQTPLHPFASPAELLQKTLNLFRRMDPEFGAYVEKLHDLGFIDLAERVNTTSVGGFSRVIGRQGNFIFMNVQRTPADVVNLAHEIGHALANYTSAQQPYQAFWGFPSDFVETPSSAMELLIQPYWDEFYTPEELPLARHQYFEQLLSHGLEVTAGNAFQHWVYRNLEAAHDLDACDAQWHDLMQRYLPGSDWTGIEQAEAMGWQSRTLNFYLPLHAMEYVYGLISGLKLATLPEDEAFHRYRTAIALGNSASTKALFAALGVDFPFTEAAVHAAAQEISAALAL